MGDGPPLVMPPGWLCHLEENWTHPAAASAREKFAADHTFVWYDRLGCGLSDRDGFELSVENDVDQLVAVLDHAGLERVSLIGYSFAAAPAAVFAARFPERVHRLVFYSAFARGRAVSSPKSFEALKHLVASNWSLGARTLATMLLPNGSSRDLRWFSRFQRRATTADMAVRLLDHLWCMDVRPALPEIAAPTLVLHNRDDPAVPFSAGRELAALIPGAELQVLDGNEHDPFIRDSGAVVDAIVAFVDGRPTTAPEVPERPPVELTRRERQVLGLLAEGCSNKDIARTLTITVATVERHITHIYQKLGAHGRADAALWAVAMGLARPPEP
jgi:pimeloyl-ACP methyl ester carboxylesterase/DNA-binding CsgD family transcriptional regulator